MLLLGLSVVVGYFLLCAFLWWCDSFLTLRVMVSFQLYSLSARASFWLLVVFCLLCPYACVPLLV